MTNTENTMTYQTTLSDADRAILSRLALPALRNESRTDDNADYRAMLAREEDRSYERIPGNGRGERPAQYVNRLRTEERMFAEMDAELRKIGVL